MNRKRVSIAVAGLVTASLLGASLADASSTSPTQAEALAGLETARIYIQAHPDAPLPSVAPTTPTATLSAAVAPTVAASKFASGMPWSDGVWSAHNAATADAFAAWRGRPVDNISAFVNRTNWTALASNWWSVKSPATNAVIPASFTPARDDFILGVPLWTDDGAAGTDAQWRALAAQIAAVDSNAWVRLGWEMNCCFSKATNATTWRAQYARAYDLMNTAKPGLRFLFNPVEGVSGPGLVADPRTLFVAGKVDAVGIDAYDFYPGYTSDTAWAGHRDKTYGWNFWYSFAVSKGVPFALPEFGVYAAVAQSGGDNPKYPTYVYKWLASKPPATIAFVTYFNEAATYCKCNVYPPTTNPLAAASYRTQINALAH